MGVAHMEFIEQAWTEDVGFTRSQVVPQKRLGKWERVAISWRSKDGAPFDAGGTTAEADERRVSLSYLLIEAGIDLVRIVELKLVISVVVHQAGKIRRGVERRKLNPYRIE